MTQLTEFPFAEEWLKFIVDRKYNLEVGTITAVGGATAGLASGQVMEGAVGARAAHGAVNPATSILVEPITKAQHIAGCKALMLCRGPAVIDITECTVGDAGAEAELAALNIISVNDALLTWSVQTK